MVSMDTLKEKVYEFLLYYITSYHFIAPHNRCETILSFLSKCQNLFAHAKHNSPSTNQANLKTSYTITFIVPNNMERQFKQS